MDFINIGVVNRKVGRRSAGMGWMVAKAKTKKHDGVHNDRV